MNNDTSRPTLQTLKEYVEGKIRTVEQERAELIRSSQALGLYRARAQTRTCPFCGGQMLYIKPLNEIYLGETRLGELPLPPNNLDRDWECQECFIATSTHAPSSSELSEERHWDRQSTPLKGGGVHVKLFRKYPRIKRIVKQWRGYRYRDWLYPG